MIAAIKRGFNNGIKTTYELAKIVIPVYFIITFLTHTSLLEGISRFMSPVMKLVGLPGKAALPVVLGFFVNIYAAIGAILPLNMSIKEITIIAAILLLAHSLPMETAIARMTGVKTSFLVLTRIIMAFIIGAFFNVVL
ncbi:nucleoside recognition domain-containing protein [Thermosyntropha sp.]|uniref:nucleoside recognition domain-containing protein n=1 Tax=Thermosyntropha sp. TaxID=2740820 RepID=UPI0025E74E7F|nr:nucleoside recognition domain-containing protein [Thermosyntropha sp.]MBO8158760.1 nucleoside recognition protein [Thermosyntropha sp.]